VCVHVQSVHGYLYMYVLHVVLSSSYVKKFSLIFSMRVEI
jgi:hypothetical protein